MPRPLPPELDAKLRNVAQVHAARGAQISLAEVSQDTGIPRATLYYHFSGRNELLTHLVSHILSENRDVVAKALTGIDDPLERLIIAVQTQYAFLTSQPETCSALFTNLGSFGDLRALAQQVHEAFHDPLSSIIEAGQASGAFRPVDDIETLTSAVFGAIIMTVMHYEVAGVAAKPGVVDTLSELVQAAVAGES